MCYSIARDGYGHCEWSTLGNPTPYCTGTGGQTFHANCDNKGPTVTLIETTTGKIIGGYASVSWSSVGSNVRDTNAFLFSGPSESYPDYAKHQIRGFVHDAYNDAALRDYPAYGPTFGDLFPRLTGPDATGTANLGNNYECRVGHTNNDECCMDFVGVLNDIGCHGWGIIQLEVWHA